MSVEGDLRQIVTKLRQIEIETLQAENNRVKVNRFHPKNFDAWKRNPSDKVAIKNLMKELDKDKVYLDTIRTHTKYVSSILQIAIRELKRISMDPKLKKKITRILKILSNTMKLASDKVKELEKKTKEMEKLEKREYSEEERGKNNFDKWALHKFEMLYTSESAMDGFIDDMLRGTFTYEWSQWTMVKQSLSFGLLGRPTGVNVPQTFVGIRSGITAQHPQELQLIVQIIELTLRFLAVFSRNEKIIAQLEKGA